MSKPVIAIVGRPNTGKSTLFNKLSGAKNAIVEDTPGVTRDRLYADGEWRGRVFTIIDTGGIEPDNDDVILKHMRIQAQVAIESADVIIFLCDLKAGLTADDKNIATMLIKSGKPIIPAINKADTIGAPPAEFYEFYELGFTNDPIPVSATHGHGTGDLLDAAFDFFPPEEETDDEPDRIKVAVIGKPNAGKSSIINRILGEERLIVSDIPGTTRDAVDTDFDNEYGKYRFIDTAGMRRQSKVDDRIEKYSVLRAKMAVDNANVCLIMIDASEGITEQDEKIAGLAHEAGKASIIVVNKWDLIEEKSNSTVPDFTNKIRIALSYMPYAPILFVSAKTGQRVGKIFELINNIFENASKRITTGILNDMLADSIARVQPPTDKGKRLKIMYMTQTGVQPPSFVIFCNDSELFHYSYQRYIENRLREVFGFDGTPIKLIIRMRGDEK